MGRRSEACPSTLLFNMLPFASPLQATGYGGTVQEGKAVEDKIRQREQNPNEEVERAAAAREVTVYFNSDVAGAVLLADAVRAGQSVGCGGELRRFGLRGAQAILVYSFQCSGRSSSGRGPARL